MLLTATTHILELVTSGTATTDYLVEFVDHTATEGTPGAASGSVSSATTTTILAAPGASTQRQLKSLAFTNVGAAAQTITIQKDVSGTNYLIFGPVTLQVGDSAVWTPAEGWVVRNAARKPRQLDQIGYPVPKLRLACGASTADLTGVKTLTNRVQIWRYAGKIGPGGASSIGVRYRVTTAGTSVNVQQLAVGSGPVLHGVPPIVKILGTATAVFDTLGQQSTTVSGLSMVEGDDLWICFYADISGVAPILRGYGIADDLLSGFQGNYQETGPATVAPSSFIGASIPLLTDAITTIDPWFAVLVTP